MARLLSSVHVTHMQMFICSWGPLGALRCLRSSARVFAPSLRSISGSFTVLRHIFEPWMRLAPARM